MKIKKMLAIFIIIVLVIATIITLFNKKKRIKKYLALGDSIAEGYALKDKNNRYSKLVQKNYNVEDNNFKDLSKSGMTAQELAERIK